MTHIDLFSGIGGFSLAFDTVFHEQKNTHIFCEIEPFAQAVLKKHWPEAEIHGDIFSFASDTGGVGLLHGKPQKLAAESPQQAQRQSAADIRSPFILTGGFPCQPFSQAGRRKGTSDDRHLWPEMLRVICATKPQWVIAENVRGILTIEHGMVFEQVCLDLEGAGYEVQPLVIPAVAVNAPHRRDRIWFVGRKNADDSQTRRRRIRIGKYKRPSTGKVNAFSHADSDAPDTVTSNGIGRRSRSTSDRERMDEDEQARKESRSESARCSKNDWNQNWLEVATRLCRVFNGLRTGVDKDMSDGIYLRHAKTLTHITGQDLPHLWAHIQSQSFQWRSGRFDSVQNKDYLFSILWQHAHGTDTSHSLPFESEEVQEAYMRNVWHTKEPGCPPQGWKYQEQYAREHKDTLPSMSYEVALVAKEIWEAFTKDRNHRLKALGNAIVPQVAEEIMLAIKYSI